MEETQRSKKDSKYRSKPDTLLIKTVICAAMSIGIVSMKYTDNAAFYGLKQTLRKYLGYGADYNQAIQTIGRAVADKKNIADIFGEESVKVFGISLINPSEGDAPGKEDTVSSDSDEQTGEELPDGQADLETDTDDDEIQVSSEADVTEDEVESLSDSDDEPLYDDQPEFTEKDFDGQSDYVSSNAPVSAAVFSFISNSTPSVISSPEQLEAISLLREEVVDNTPATEFAKPTPAIVDDTVYTLGFKYGYPHKGAMTSKFGYRIHPITGVYSFHYGVDIGADKGDTISSFADGTVIETGTGTVYGKYVKVQHADGYWTRYCHLNKISVKEGQKVKLGQKIGEAGATGWATGVHLHFELRKNDRILNPMEYLKF